MESPLHVTLVQGVSRGERMDYTVQKAVELGVAAIVPVLTEPQRGEAGCGKAEEEAHSLAGGGGQRLRTIGPRTGTGGGAAGTPGELSRQARGTASLKLLLDPLAESGHNGFARPNRCARSPLLVGPEGGLSENGNRARDPGGFTGLGLGPRILRTETAALVALSLLAIAMGRPRLILVLSKALSIDRLLRVLDVRLITDDIKNSFAFPI